MPTAYEFTDFEPTARSGIVQPGSREGRRSSGCSPSNPSRAAPLTFTLNHMLLLLKRRIADGFLVAADVAGVAVSGSGAAVVAVLGKLMLAVVLGAIALGFFLRLAGRRRGRVVVPPRIPVWSRAVSAGLAAVEVALLVEATNFPVRFDQTGFEPWHWILVLVALAVTYPLNLRVMGRLIRRRPVTSQP